MMFAAGKQLMTAQKPVPNNTKSLLHFNGANESTTITDECGITWTNSGSVPLSTSTSKFGTASLKAPTARNTFLYSNDPVFNKAGKAVFTVECWFNGTAVAYNTIFETTIGTTTDPRPLAMVTTPSAQIQVTIGNAALSAWAVNANYGSGVTANTWHHIAVVGDGTNITVYLNGTSIYSGAHINWSSGAGYQSFGTPYYGTGQIYIDEFRYSDIARYTSNFTPPTAEFLATG